MLEAEGYAEDEELHKDIYGARLFTGFWDRALQRRDIYLKDKSATFRTIQASGLPYGWTM